MKFKVINLGCKVNAYESTYIEECFINEGYEEASSLDDANVIIVNTCSVTNVADQKCRKLLRKIKRENPSCTLIACGCSTQNKFDEYENFDIDILLGNSHKSEIFNLYKKYLETHEKIRIYEPSRKKDFDSMKLDFFSKHTRAFIKIQDGCDNFCSYCVIPIVRGSIRSKNFDETVEEVKELVKNKHEEIVLVGIHTGSYNYEGKDLVDLINELSKIEGLKRIRISSIEITELNDKFLDMLKNNEKVVNHMHIPLQAGSDEILKLMNRKYDLKYFEDKIKTIRSIRPDINITTDVIVGHPYETDELFLKTVDFCNKIEFGKIHVFPYSKRDNTKAALMDNQVSEEEKKERARKLIRISEILENKYNSKFIGKTLRILTEKNHQDEIVGFTDNYIKVYVKNGENLKPNMDIFVKLEEVKDDYVLGTYMKEE